MDLVINQANPLPVLPAFEPVAPRWYALYTVVRHEKVVADQVRKRGLEAYLPLYETVHRWGQRRAKVQLPLFPGYVFVRMPLTHRLVAVSTPGVVRFVSFNGSPEPLPDFEIDRLRLAQTAGNVEPHPYLQVGRRVRVRSGPLAGLEGLIVRRKRGLRLVLSIDLLMRAVSVEVDAADLAPIC